MDDDNTVTGRHFSRSSQDYQNKEKGQIIKSLRKFGVEIEMVHDTAKAIKNLSKLISESFGIEHDGSINAGSGYGVEVVTPIMAGGAGESGIVEMFSSINKLEFSVNKTCGLHVHLDGEGFSQTDNVFVRRLSDVDCKKGLEGVSDRDGDYVFVVKEDVMEALLNSISVDEAARLVCDEYISTRRDSLYLSKELGRDIKEIQRTTSNVTIGKDELLLDLFTFPVEFEEEKLFDGIEITGPEINDSDFLCIVRGNKNLRNVLTLLYLHTVYSDVFLAMLPRSRKENNLYCQSLSLGFSATQIENIRSFSELENAWYNTRSVNETRRRKGNNYDDSRYFTMNLHSLFAKYGTIEIRSHSATLDHNKVLYWIAFHQEILDRIVAGKITIANLREGINLHDLDSRVDFLISRLGLRNTLAKYMQRRITYFKNNK